MRGFKAFAFAATATVLLAGSLQAQGTGLVKWMGVNGAHSLYNKTVGSTAGAQDIYRSPYFAQFKMTGEQLFGPTVDIFCVDFLNESDTSKEGYNAYFTNLGTNAADIGDKTRSGRTLTQYLQVAWLGSQMVNPTLDLDPVTHTRNENQLRAMQATMWYIMSGSPLYYMTTAVDNMGNAIWYTLPSINVWITRANAGLAQWTAADRNQWAVVTDVDAAGKALGGSQEYVTQVTPEPATMLLLGTGLVVMLIAAGALRRPVA